MLNSISDTEAKGVSQRGLLKLALLLAAVFCCLLPSAHAQEATKTVKTFKLGT